MVIDIHCHWHRKAFLSDNYWQLLSRFTAEEMGRLAGSPTSAQLVEETILPTWWDDTGEAIIPGWMMRELRRALFSPRDVGLLTGEGAVDIGEQLAQIAALVRTYPQRLLFCPNIDPRRPEALKLFERCLTEWGARP